MIPESYSVTTQEDVLIIRLFATSDDLPDVQLKADWWQAQWDWWWCDDVTDPITENTASVRDWLETACMADRPHPRDVLTVLNEHSIPEREQNGA